MYDADIRAFLTELYAAGQHNDSQQQERDKKMLNLEVETAQFLNILVRSSRRTRLLEIGTSNGYSTIWLAWAARSIGGQVISMDRDEPKLALADANLRQAGLRDVVELICGDATQVVADLTGPFDFVFFDADRLSAPSQLALLLPKLTADVLLLADNALSHPQEIAVYLSAVQVLPQFDHLVIPIGKGLSMAYRQTGNEDRLGEV